jgi:predicted lipid-binding transport protein (Tim44 family)
MSYILTPNGRRPIVPINESAEQVNDTEMNIDLDVEHFLDYVMENFPELTEKYIEENYEQVDELSHSAIQDYRSQAKADKKDLEDYPSHFLKHDQVLQRRYQNRKKGLDTAMKKVGGSSAKVSAKPDNAPGNNRGNPITMMSRKGSFGKGRD